MDGNTNLILTILVLILFSAFFSATETAFSSANKIRLKNLMNEGNKKAKLAYELTEKYDELLSTILVGNNLVNIMSTALATVLFTRIYGNLGATLSTVVMTVAVLIFGEVTPKSLAKESPEKFVMFAAPFVNVLRIILMPINFLFTQWKKLMTKIFRIENDDSMTQEELLTIIEDAHQDGDLEIHESELISAAIEFNDLEVKEVLTPRVEVIAINVQMKMETIEEAFRENRYSRLPVFENSIDNIVGVVHEKDFYYAYYNQAKNIKGIIKPVQFTSGSVKISALLRDLQSTKTHMAIVLDEYGGTTGIITMEDILEELVGEIYDEHDEVREYYRQVDDRTYLVDGDCDLEDMFDLFGKEDLAEEFDVITTSGWVTEMLHKIPVKGDTFTYDELFVTIVSADTRRVKEIKVEHMIDSNND